MSQVKCVRHSDMIILLSLCVMFVKRGSPIMGQRRVKVVSYLGCLGMHLLQSG